MSGYEGPMFASPSHRLPLSRAVAALALLAFGIGVSGCAQVGETMSPAFADPAKYDLYECKQLGAERTSLAIRIAETQGLMAKAETGVAGPVVAELAYRNDYISLRAQAKLAEEAWRRNKCKEDAPAAPVAAPAPAATAKGARSPSRSGSAVY